MNCLTTSRIAGLAVCLCLLAGAAGAAPNNSLLDISSDGKLLACSNRDSGTLAIVDLATKQKLHEVAVGGHPEGVSFLGDSHRVAVAAYDDDTIVFVDGDSGSIEGKVEVFDEPYGVVSDRAGKRIFTTLDYPGQVVEIDVEAKKIVRSLECLPHARGLAIARDEQRLFVSGYYSGDVVAIELAGGKIVDRWPGISNDNLARQIIVHPKRPKLYLPHIRSRVTAVHGEGSIFPYVSAIDTEPGEGKRRRRIPMDAFLGNLVVSNPWDAAISPDGKQFYVVFAGTNDMFACEVIDDDYTEIKNRRLMRLGNNPRAVRVSPDAQTVYVYNALDFEVVGYDTGSLNEKARIRVTDSPLSEKILRGKILFYSALQPMVGRRWISCASCHPDGQPDGRTWHNPEGLRNTQSLAGMSWTHPIHWSADRDEVQDFEYTIRGPLMQGRGLLRGTLNKELAEPNRGLSEDLDAMSAYSNTHRYTLSPHAKSGLSDAAKRGRDIFFSAETKCATCHSGPMYCDSQPGKEIVRHDVGTGDDDPGEKMGPAYDTPTLLGVYRTAPYLHHGRAATLEEVFTKCNEEDKHGKTSHLSADQIRDLVEFLKALPYEDPEPAAHAAGLKQIVD